MKRLRPRRTFGLALAIVSMLPVGAAPSGFDRLNLDLPYNAAGGDSEEDDWVDTVHFYGVSFEANAVVFCLDESQSMFGPRWEAQKREITRSIRNLDSRTRFNVVVWGLEAKGFRPDLQPASETNKLVALNFIDSRQLSYGQALKEGLIKSLSLLENSDSEHRAVILTSDGAPNNDNGRLFSESLAANPGGQTQVHTVLMGSNHDDRSVRLMKELAVLHRGKYRNAR